MTGALENAAAFAENVVTWQKAYGRQELPWMVKDAYCRWVSEIMLQQTQVVTVKAYYGRFTAAFPDVKALAAASEDDVMRLWAGLGYYSRARNLHACAKVVAARYGGEFPRTPEALAELPGIGRSTAAAIASAAYGVVAPILDGNVKRVLTRVLADPTPLGTSASEKRLWTAADTLVSRTDPGTYNQGMMDLGNLVCTRTQPKCAECPIRVFCAAQAAGRATDFPVKKPKAPKPVREADMTVYADMNGVWLEKRCGAGVWKGLWSLPEVRGEGSSPADGFVHDFSHYRLSAHVWRVEGAPPAAYRELVEMRQVPWEDVAAEAVPTPVKTFLTALPRS